MKGERQGVAMKHLVGKLSCKNLFITAFFIFFKSYSAEPEYMSLSFDTLYPKSDFNRVEVACKELWSDLDLLVNNQDLYIQWMHGSDYLVDQFLLIERSLEKLTAIENSENGYLKEDIQYLAQIISILESKIQELAMYEHAVETKSIHCITFLLAKSKEHIAYLFTQNKEEIVS